MESVYLETSVISYLTARPSRDLLVAANQQVTHEWWATRRSGFICLISQIVVDEVSLGDANEARKRLAVIDGLSALRVTHEVNDLTQAIMSTGSLPAKAFEDAAHVAVATVYKADYLLTWNCRHLANAQIKRKIESVCRGLGYRMPIICTPQELMGE